MEAAAISAAIALLGQVAPSLTATTAIASAIKFVSTVLVPGIKLAKDEVPVIKGIIATLRGNKTVTAEQMAELDQLDARCDAVLDSAIEKAEAEDGAAGST